MGKLLILLIIIAGAFWLGRLSVRLKKDNNNNSNDNTPIDESSVIDVEIEDES